MTKSLHRLRHLNITMIQWAEENKLRSRRSGQLYELPAQFKKDFRFVTKCDGKVSMRNEKLTREEMKECNKIYKFYRKVYNKLGLNENR